MFYTVIVLQLSYLSYLCDHFQAYKTKFHIQNDGEDIRDQSELKLHFAICHSLESFQSAGTEISSETKC